MFKQLSLFFLLARNVSSFSVTNPTDGNISGKLQNTKSLDNAYGLSSRNGKIQQYRRQSQQLMCGLVAAIDDVWSQKSGTTFSDVPLLNDYEKEGNENKVLTETTQKLHHRGPDGMTVANGLLGEDSAKARWAMGHTRLAIVDPNNRKADMPFQLDFEVKGETKTVKLAANGEIYNHEKVYSDLVQKDGWNHDRISQSDCEVIAHSFAQNGGPATAKALDGMFAFVIFEENQADGTVKAFAARDPVGIKPLYYGRKSSSDDESQASSYVFSSELKALVGQVDPETVVAIPPGHYWTPEEGLVCFYNPDWLRKVRNPQIFYQSVVI